MDHTDQLSGASAITNSSGTLQENVDYYPFGSIRNDTKSGSFSEQRKFAGHEYDGATGLSYMDARYYDGSRGRFISEDQLFLSIGDSKQFGDIIDKTAMAIGKAANSDSNDQDEQRQKHSQQLENLLSDPQRLNSYSYVQNNPLKSVDPNGLFGIGVTYGGTTELGALIFGAGATASVGGGAFWSPSTGASLGAFTNVGGFAAASTDIKTSYPSLPSKSNWALGGYAGFGSGDFISNANNVGDLVGPSKTYSINLGVGTYQGGIQFSLGKNSQGKPIWMVSLSSPVTSLPLPSSGVGASISGYNNITTDFTKLIIKRQKR